MGRTHEINKLEFQIDGYTDHEIEQTIREVLTDVIETYFDKYSLPDKSIFIDKIQFDLGTIKSGNFKEELVVRISYLLQTELRKFFDQPNIEDRLEEKIIISYTDAFITYLQKGYSKLDSQDLGQLFEHLLLTNIAQLREIMREVRQSPSARQRLFYQVKYESLEQYWSKVHTKVFQQVKFIENQILADSGQSKLIDYKEDSIGGFLRKQTFDFMIDNVGTEADIAYLERLKAHVDELKHYEHAFKKSAFNYLDELSEKILKGSSKGIEKPEVKLDRSEILFEYIVSGKVQSRSSTVVLERSKEFTEQELEILGKRIVEENQCKQEQFKRLLSIFSSRQLEIILRILAQSGKDNLANRIGEISYLRTIIRELFNEDIYLLNLSDLPGYLTATSDKKLAEQIKGYIESISARKWISTSAAAKSLRQRMDRSAHKHSRAINKLMQQLQSELEEPEEYKKSKPSDPMTAYMHFLRTGIWVLENATPQQVLIKLLEESPEHLSLELFRHLSKQTVWLRLVYQHQVEVIKTLFETVFKGDDDLTLLLDKLENLESSEFKELLQRKLMEAFVIAKTLIKANDKLSFEAIFEKTLADLSVATKTLQANDKLSSTTTIDELLSVCLSTDQKQIKLEKSQRASIIQSLTYEPHHLNAYITDQGISDSNWEQFLKVFDKGELLQILKAIVPLRSNQIQWFSLFIYRLNDDELGKLLNKSKLTELLVLLIKNEVGDIENFIADLLEEIKEKQGSLVKKASAMIPFLDQDLVATSTHKSLTKGLALSKKETSSIIKAIETYFDELKSVGVPITQSYWNKLVIGLLPFAKTAEELKQRIITKLIADYPQYYDFIKTVKGEKLVKKKRVISFSELVQELIEMGSFNVKPHFENFDRFENYFVYVLQSSDYLNEALFVSNPRRLVEFLKQLTPETIEILGKSTQNKFSGTDFSELKEQVIDANNALKKQIEFYTISFGLTHSKFEASVFLNFINVHNSGIQLREIPYLMELDETSGEVFPALYVEAFIHYLKFRKHIYLPLEQEGIQEGLNKIITYWPDELLSQLTRSTSIQQLMESVLLLIPESRQSNIFTYLFPYQRTQVKSVMEQLLKTTKVSKAKILAVWTELNLTSQRLFSTNQTIDHLKAILKPEAKPTFQFQLVSKDKGDIYEELPQTFVRQGIVEGDSKRYTVFELLNEIIKDGRLPFWLEVQSRQEFDNVLNEIIRQAPDTIKKIFANNLKTVRATQNVHRLIGSTTLESVIKTIEPSIYSDLMQNVKKLVKAHLDLGKTDALTEYFFIRYLTEFYATGKAPSGAIVVNILSNVAFDFGLSSTDYYELLQKSKDKSIKEFRKASKSAGSEVPESGTAYQIDLLLHLVAKDEIPWWASESFDKNQPSIEKIIVELVSNLIEKDPKTLITSIAGKADSENIYQRILPNITNQQVDKLLLIWAPDFGGFMVSFNLLIIRSKAKINKASWFSFLLLYASETKKYKASLFLERALSVVSKLTGENVLKVRSKLLDIAKTAIKNGEMRFLPFIELLGSPIEKDKSPISTPESPIKIESVGFIDGVVYYIVTGSLPSGSFPQISSYFDFTKSIERQLKFGHNELRLAVNYTLTDEKVRARLIKNEKAHFLNLMIRILYPSETNQLLIVKNKLVQLFTQKWADVSRRVLDEIFYRSIFEHTLENQTVSLNTTDLIISFIQKVSQLLNLEFKFSHDELKNYKLDSKLIHELSDVKSAIMSDRSKKKPIGLPLIEDKEDSLIDHRILIKNAGLVIIWPYLTRYFDMLEMTDEGKFKTENDAIRAVHLLQYIATGTAMAPEHELLLNKVLCGLKVATPIPLEVVLTDKEIETSKMMIKGLLQNWEKLKSSSIEALREGFLTRDGYILEKEKTWELKVEKKTLDILMESMPWAFGTIKLPWMKKRLNVEWL